MVEQAALRAIKFVHLLPEHVAFALPALTYAKVSRRTRNGVFVTGLGDTTGCKWTITQENAVAWAVDTAEVEAYNGRSLVRAPVAVLANESFIHGQVTECEINRVKVRTEQGVFTVGPSDVYVTKPLPAIILSRFDFPASQWSRDEVKELHNSIWNRATGGNGETASNCISTLLSGIVNDAELPSSNEVVTWTEPKTGNTVKFPLQHAVDYTYHINGSINPVPVSIGPDFCTLPRSPLTTTRPSAVPLRNNADALFDPEVDDDVAPVVNIHGPDTVRDADRQLPPARKRARLASSAVHPSRTPSDVHPTSDDELLATIASRPDLQRRIAHQLLNGPAARVTAVPPTPPQTTRHTAAGQVDQQVEFSRPSFANQTVFASRPTRHQQYTAEMDDYYYAAVERPSFASRTVFTPSPVQHRIHQQITSPRHQGKTAPEFVDELVNSGAVLFKPLPGVLIRVYDIQFGARGLSIMHFIPIDEVSRMNWQDEGGANFQAFGTALSAPKPPRASAIGDVVAACQAFSVYALEYFVPDMQTAASTLLSVMQRLAGPDYHWTEPDLPFLVFWINSVLESHRTAIEKGVTSEGELSSQFDINNGRLQHVIQMTISRQVHRLKTTAFGHADSVAPAHHTATQNEAGIGRRSPIPKEVDDLIPSKDGQKLCLRFLSNRGCKTTKDSRCYSGRAHFVPESLHPRVKSLIRRRFGGIKTEHASL